VRWIEVSEEEAGQRIDNYLLARLKGVPKSHIYRILRSGEVRLNSKRVDASDKVGAGDRIRIPPVRVAQRDAAIPAPHFKLPILFEDEWLVAIDKPAGLAVHGGSGIAHGVIESLRSMRPQARFLELVHRLDRDTSGVLLVAKKRSALTAMHELMRGHDIDKRYIVGTKGRFRNATQRVRAALAKRVAEAGEKRVFVSESGQPAETLFTRLGRGPEASLLEAQLVTGRTHQIRVHLAHIHHPLVGDPLYGGSLRLPKGATPELVAALRGFRRQALHAERLAFEHPVTGETMAFEARRPADMEALIAVLRADAAEHREL
jgi:23S rRNA pseudouridine955/2504/2580 synthase